MTVCRSLDNTWYRACPSQTKRLTSVLQWVFKLNKRILVCYKNSSDGIAKDKDSWEEIRTAQDWGSWESDFWTAPTFLKAMARFIKSCGLNSVKWSKITFEIIFFLNKNSQTTGRQFKIIITASCQLQFKQKLALISEGITRWDHSERKIQREGKKKSKPNNK